MPPKKFRKSGFWPPTGEVRLRLNAANQPSALGFQQSPQGSAWYDGLAPLRSFLIKSGGRGLSGMPSGSRLTSAAYRPQPKSPAASRRLTDGFAVRIRVGILVVHTGGALSGLLGALPPDPRSFFRHHAGVQKRTGGGFPPPVPRLWRTVGPVIPGGVALQSRRAGISPDSLYDRRPLGPRQSADGGFSKGVVPILVIGISNLHFRFGATP